MPMYDKVEPHTSRKAGTTHLQLQVFLVKFMKVPHFDTYSRGSIDSTNEQDLLKKAVLLFVFQHKITLPNNNSRQVSFSNKDTSIRLRAQTKHS